MDVRSELGSFVNNFKRSFGEFSILDEGRRDVFLLLFVVFVIGRVVIKVLGFLGRIRGICGEGAVRLRREVFVFLFSFY